MPTSRCCFQRGAYRWQRLSRGIPSICSPRTRWSLKQYQCLGVLQSALAACQATSGGSASLDPWSALRLLHVHLGKTPLRRRGMDKHTANEGTPQDQTRSTIRPETATTRSLSSQDVATETPQEQEPVVALSEQIGTVPDLPPSGEAILLTEETNDAAASTLQSSVDQHFTGMTRWHLLIGLGVAAGVTTSSPRAWSVVVNGGIRSRFDPKT